MITHVILIFIITEPAYFVDSRETSDEVTEKTDGRNTAADAAAAYENSVFVKSINEFQDFKLKCLAKGKPRPTVSWHLRYINNTLIRKFYHHPCFSCLSNLNLFYRFKYRR